MLGPIGCSRAGCGCGVGSPAPLGRHTLTLLLSCTWRVADAGQIPGGRKVLSPLRCAMRPHAQTHSACVNARQPPTLVTWVAGGEADPRLTTTGCLGSGRPVAIAGQSTVPRHVQCVFECCSYPRPVCVKAKSERGTSCTKNSPRHNYGRISQFVSMLVIK